MSTSSYRDGNEFGSAPEVGNAVAGTPRPLLPNEHDLASLAASLDDIDRRLADLDGQPSGGTSPS